MRCCNSSLVTMELYVPASTPGFSLLPVQTDALAGAAAGELNLVFVDRP